MALSLNDSVHQTLFYITEYLVHSTEGPTGDTCHQLAPSDGQSEGGDHQAPALCGAGQGGSHWFVQYPFHLTIILVFKGFTNIPEVRVLKGTLVKAHLTNKLNFLTYCTVLIRTI